MPRRPSREIGVEVLASVMKCHRSIHDLMDMLGNERATLDRWVKQYRESGIFYIAGWIPQASGSPTAIYGMQPRPFLMEDMPRPPLKLKPRNRRKPCPSSSESVSSSSASVSA